MSNAMETQDKSTFDLLSEVLERVRAATGSDKELDALIDAASHGCTTVVVTGGNALLTKFPDGTGDVLGWIDPGEVARNFTPLRPFPAYTSDLNAIVGLIEKELPTYDWRVERDNDGFGGGFYVAYCYPVANGEFHYEGGSTPALALCAAFLALSPSTNRGDEG